MATKQIKIGTIGPFEYDSGDEDADNAARRGDVNDVADPNTFIDGTANEIVVTDDGDETCTLSGGGTDVSFDVLTALRDNAGTIEYKSRTITFNGGIATVGSESSWTAI